MTALEGEMELPRISHAEFVRGWQTDTFCVVDCRPHPSFNGWKLSETLTRRGCLPSSHPLPLSLLDWTQKHNKPEVLFQKAQELIQENQQIVVVGDTPHVSGVVACSLLFPLQQLNYRQGVVVYGEGFEVITNDPSLPLVFPPSFHLLVHPNWIFDLLNGRIPEKYQKEGENKEFLLFHCNFENENDYHEGHLPTAIHMDISELEDPKTWNRTTPQELEETLCKWGITQTTTVILYGRTTIPTASQLPGKHAGQIAAFRAFLILSYAGVQDVRVLDGGYDAWVQWGGSITTDPFFPKSVQSTLIKPNIPGSPHFINDYHQVQEIGNTKSAVLVSMRSLAEFVGEVSGYLYIHSRGDIQGAVFGNSGDHSHSVRGYRAEDDRHMKSHLEIVKMLKEFGETDHLCFFCGTGWRASEVFFYCQVLGRPASVYDGGWFEWSAKHKEQPHLFPVTTHNFASLSQPIASSPSYLHSCSSRSSPSCSSRSSSPCSSLSSSPCSCSSSHSS